MANYIGYTTTKSVSTTHIAKIKVPSGGIEVGSFVQLGGLNNDIANNYEVFNIIPYGSADITSERWAIVTSGSSVETLSDGRKPIGQPNYTEYTYKENDIITVIMIDKHLQFEIGIDAVDGATTATPSSDIGKFIVPSTTSYTASLSNSNIGYGCSMLITGVKYFPLGNHKFATTYTCIGMGAHNHATVTDNPVYYPTVPPTETSYFATNNQNQQVLVSVSRWVDMGSAYIVHTDTVEIPTTTVAIANFAYNAFIVGTKNQLKWAKDGNTHYMQILSAENVSGTQSITTIYNGLYHVKYSWTDGAETLTVTPHEIVMS